MIKPQTRQEIRDMAKPKSYTKVYLLIIAFIAVWIWVLM